VSVEPFRGMHTPVCDGRGGECEARLPGEMSFADAVASMQRARWRSQRSDKNGEYINICPECQKEEKREQEKRKQSEPGGQHVCPAAAPDVRRM
jgi:hypothetical protein